MKRLLLISALLAAIAGCSSSDPIASASQYSNLSGGQSAGDSTSFYWLTKKLGKPHTAADFVTSGDYGSYSTDYRWDDGVLRELVRQGFRLQSPVGSENNPLIPYRVHIRFSASGEAVYQQYRLDGKVRPLSTNNITRYQQEALSLYDIVNDQHDDNLELIQGYWDGETFETCNGREFQQLEFNQTLPSFVVNRLSSVDNYVALLGTKEAKKVSVSELLMLSDDNYDCVKRPSWIETE
ncbi:DUF1481 domain-containing protein [Vibrio tapetis]|uniref:Peptidylprolyl isomerase n=1 Tax=Vibrio tapetis subsp. tapetis TaxID=1671868 RepID=A0A2N8ZG33_9VIBR|nr:DUF1481 domain-containing protein [Vibrio tapetis]SON50874.1 conserved exported protein of unknown function [Vibrio tapetis subsp. tapetis]